MAIEGKGLRRCFDKAGGAHVLAVPRHMALNIVNKEPQMHPGAENSSAQEEDDSVLLKLLART